MQLGWEVGPRGSTCRPICSGPRAQHAASGAALTAQRLFCSPVAETIKKLLGVKRAKTDT